MILLHPITPQNTPLFKSIRLHALQDTPTAFGSTYARESQLSDVDWIERARRWNGDKGIGFLAIDGEIPCGMAGCFLDQEDATQAQLISMWTAPTHRQRGIGRMLVNEILGWASERGATTLRLLVTSHNVPAISFYERLGFTRTGRTELYPNDPALTEIEMSRPVASP